MSGKKKLHVQVNYSTIAYFKITNYKIIQKQMQEKLMSFSDNQDISGVMVLQALETYLSFSQA